MDTTSAPLHITQDTVLEPRTYDLPGGILIDGDDLTLDGNGALLIGSGRQGCGVSLSGRQRVTIKNLRVREYAQGIHADGCSALAVTGCQITSTAETPANTIFLDVWNAAGPTSGCAVFLASCSDSRIEDNDLQHQMSGLVADSCQRLEVRRNNASYCSAWGFCLWKTCDSLYEDNIADYCCRYQPRGPRQGHVGADAAGFLIITSSSRNVFRRNLARLGGDGFFMAGLSMTLGEVPCNDNLFEENDGSYSPNIAFESTFCARNTFRNNAANHCNYGFWLGFSRDGVIENNQIQFNAQAGIATENGIDFKVKGNQFVQNGHGILLWSKYIPEFDRYVPQNDTSRDWLIEENQFTGNNKAVRIAANQDHGLVPYPVPSGEDAHQFRRPHDHTLRQNVFVSNQVTLETIDVEHTDLED